MTRHTPTPAEHAIKRRLKELGISVQAAAEAAGITTNTWRNILRGATAPRVENIHAIERVLGWVPGELEALLGDTPATFSAPASNLTEEIKRVGHLQTDQGDLTWMENSDGTRDYTLSRQIRGQERGVSTHASTLSLAGAIANLTPALEALESFYRDEVNRP